jgi:hypothetical protein
MGENLKLITKSIAVQHLMAKVIEHGALFDAIKGRQEHPGSPHIHTRSIFLRGPKELTVDAIFNALDNHDYMPMALLEAMPIIEGVMAKVGAEELGRVMIVELAQNGYIKEHADEGKYADHFERFHVVLESEFGNEFFVRRSQSPDIGELACMKNGEAWWFNHKQPHWVYNGSFKPRYHLIFDAVAPAYRRERQSC